MSEKAPEGGKIITPVTVMKKKTISKSECPAKSTRKV